jgi:hypothetical protein
MKKFKKRKFSLLNWQIKFLFYFVAIASMYYFKSFFLGAYSLIILIALLPSISFTKDDLTTRKYYLSRNSDQIKREKLMFKKQKIKDWRIAEGFGQKNIYFFLIITFIKNFVSWFVTIYFILAMCFVILGSFISLNNILGRLNAPYFGSLSILKIIGILVLVSMLSGSIVIISEWLKKNRNNKK